MTTMNSQDYSDEVCSTVLYGAIFLFSVLLFCPLTLLIYKLYPQPDARLVNIFAEWNRTLLAPEGAERLAYVFGLLYLLIVPALLSKYSERFFEVFKAFIARQVGSRLRFWNKLGTFLFVLWIFAVSALAVLEFKIYLLFGLSLVVSFLVAQYLLRKPESYAKATGSLKVLLLSVSVAFLLFSAVLLLINDNILLSMPEIKGHFTVLLGAISQVFNGRTVLVDLTSQYGILYPYLGALVVKVFGPSVSVIGLFFVCLVFFASVFLMLAVYRKMQVSLGSFLFLLPIIGLSHPFFYAAILGVDPYSMAPYYAYLPVRVVCGAFMLYFSKVYLDNPSFLNYFIGTSAVAVSVLWNIDTGIVIALSWLALVSFRSLTIHSFSARAAIAFVVHVLYVSAALAAAVIIYSLFAKARSGLYPQWGEAFRYQALFYKAGFMMLKMRLFDVWQVPILVYSFVIFKAVKNLIRGSATLDNNWYFFIAVYGLGIFSYYQGRSHIYCLTAVAYPAILLIAFLAYDTLWPRKEINMDSGLIPSQTIAWWRQLRLSSLLLPLIICLLSFPVKTSKYLYTLIGKAEKESISEKYSVQIEFIKMHKPNGDLLILSDDAEILYFLAGAVSPLPFASLPEIILKADILKLQTLLDNGQIKRVLVAKCFFPLIENLSFSNYKVGQPIPGFVVYEQIHAGGRI